MSKYKPNIDPITIFMLAWLLVIMLSCNVIKAKRSTRATTDSVSRQTTAVVDTSQGGAVSKAVSRETFDWSKLTLQYPPGDTNITNIYNYPQRPATVIYETGKVTKEETRTDSTWFKNAISSLTASVDSLSRKLAEQTKDKETRPNIWLYAGIMIGILVIWKGIGWVTSKYTFFIPKTKV